MTTPIGFRRAAALPLLLAAVVAGCGVPAEDTAREVDPPDGVSHAWATQTPLDPAPGVGAIPARLYLVRDGELVAVTRHVDTQPSVDELVDALLAGPTDAEQRDGLTSALLGNDIVVGVQFSGGRATVELTDTLDETGRSDQILAFAQIVCTLAARPGVTAVSFTRAGQPVGVPRADGSLSESPATAADYASLVSGR
ncbi:GerMN domain-containing protein [Plantactinospora sp. KLBMP9567]|uniref:GerMN domain-containing protein n=1 Tax=Plantactinospora sp. KLBMP9567 TaxID=3085900 RepID=UPI0029827C59|nr:GerMN domain-containing protein [Plantactinospora sp. KLBMP9567]MDW5329690.1 GerMN domain-containing protein [Plantactinospora sp. KLBMP9567]